MKTKIVSCHTADSKPVKQEVNGTVILPPLVFPGYSITVTLYSNSYSLGQLCCKKVLEHGDLLHDKAELVKEC